MKTFKTPAAAVAVVAALGLALPVVPAMAQDQRVEVPYADLNLATPEGQKTLERRIDNAARKVCDADRHEIGSRIASREAKKCIKSVKKQITAHLASVRDETQLGG